MYLARVGSFIFGLSTYEIITICDRAKQRCSEPETGPDYSESHSNACSVSAPAMRESTTCCNESMNKPRTGFWNWSEFARAFWMRLAMATMSSSSCSVDDAGNLWQSSSKTWASKAVRFAWIKRIRSCSVSIVCPRFKQQRVSSGRALRSQAQCEAEGNADKFPPTRFLHGQFCCDESSELN